MVHKSINIIDHFLDRYTSQLLDLFQREWWTKNRTLDDVNHILEFSDFNFSVIETSNEKLIGFSRVLTDYKYFAFIFDLIIEENYRREGIGSKLLEEILSHPKITVCHSIELCCPPDREKFYKKFGFSASSGRMRLRHPNADF